MRNGADDLPLYSTDLLELLDRQYPHQCPVRGQDAEDVQRYAGKRELIDALLMKLQPEEERIY